MSAFVPLLCSLLWIFSPAEAKDVADVEVSCVFMESCILPCSFQPGPDVVIHWIQETTGNTPAHAYYHNQDQLVAQGQHFRGRTSLFQDQISRGNASLQLTGVKVQDQGRYQCYTSTGTAALRSFINLKVEDVADVEVSCVFMESCILPCSFQPGPDVVIHWIQETTGNTPVHAYYHNQDQLTLQSQHFRGRTSLFQDQISRGNASLQLTGVKVQDQGRYQCYTSTGTAAEKTFIILKVEVHPPDQTTKSNVGNIAGVCVIISVIAVVGGMVIYCKKTVARRPSFAYTEPDHYQMDDRLEAEEEQEEEESDEERQGSLQDAEGENDT